MSSTTIKAIYPGERHEDIEVLRNSWGTAPIVWDAMFKAYVPSKHEYDSWLMDRDGRLWAMYDRQDIPLNHRVVLALTFDRAYVLKKDYARAAADLRKFFADFPLAEDRGVNHWPHIIALFESDPAHPAIGFYWTSVSEDPFEGPWNEEREEHDQPDWAKCWSLYDEVDAPDEPNRATDGVPVVDRNTPAPSVYDGNAGMKGEK
jgi:hypothetical protein